MRFRLATAPGGGSDPYSGIGQGFAALGMLPLLQAQAAEEGQTAGAKRQLLESQIAENMAQAAIKEQERKQLEGRPDVLKLMGATRSGLSVPHFEAAIREKTMGLPIGPSILENREQPFNDAITTLYGPALATPADKVNWDQLAGARGKYQTQDVLDQVLQGKVDAGRAGSAVAASKGTAQFNNVGNTGVGFNVHTGQGTVLDAALNALFQNEGQSRIRENNAQAGQANASAGLSSARRDRVVGGYDKPVTILDDATGEANITRIPTGQAPVTVGVAPAKKTGTDATNAKERNRVVRDVEKEMVGASDAEIQAEVERRMSRRGQPAAKAPAAPAAPQVDMGKAADVKARYKAGKITRAQAQAELRALGFK